MTHDLPGDVSGGFSGNQPDSDWLADIVDCLLPGDDQHWPSATSLGLCDRVMEFIRQSPEGDQVLAKLFALTQPGFGKLDRTEQVVFLQTLESNEPALFELLVTAAYNMYYTEPDVRQIIEQVTGYEARPPQPEGYNLEPFDEALLSSVRRRDPFWHQETEQ